MLTRRSKFRSQEKESQKMRKNNCWPETVSSKQFNMWEPPKAFEHHAKCLFEAKKHTKKAQELVAEIQALPTNDTKLAALRMRAHYYNTQREKWQKIGLETFQLEKKLREEMDKKLAIRMQEDSIEERNILYSTVTQLSADEIQESYNGWVSNHQRGNSMYNKQQRPRAPAPAPSSPPPRPPPPLKSAFERTVAESSKISAPNKIVEREAVATAEEAGPSSRTPVLQEMLKNYY